MVPISAKELLKGLWPAAPAGLSITAVVTDSRQVVPGCVFVAIQGERVDGANFAPGALEDGAALVVSERTIEGVPADRTVLVADVLDAMIAMGANYRDGFSPLVLGVTGSVGKTTTKEFCGAVFSAFGETLKTEGNQNNEIGLPNTLFRMDENTRYAVLEMGMQKKGEVQKLAMAARPDGAIITKIGAAHIETMGSMENILRAKMEICDGMVPGAPLVLNGDDALLFGAKVPGNVVPVYAGIENAECEVRAENLRREGSGQRFAIVDTRFGEYEALIPAIGRHNVQNALLAYAAATRLGLAAPQSVAALAAFAPADMRQRVVEMYGVTVIEDCYNANPDSMTAALATLCEVGVPGGRIAVLGDMLELGTEAEKAHVQLGRQCAEAGLRLLVTVGELAGLAAKEAAKGGVSTAVCDDNAHAAAVLSEAARNGDTVLVKASRGMKFEEILAAFLPGNTGRL